MRKFRDKDRAPLVACCSVRLSKETYQKDYSKCRVRKDLPFEEDYVYVIIPFERVAVDAVLEVWGIEKDGSEKHKKAYVKIANETLRFNTQGLMAELQSRDMPEDKKVKFGKIIEIVDAYQKKLKEKGLDLPEPFSPIVTQPKKEDTTPAHTFENLIKNQPDAPITPPVKPVEAVKEEPKAAAEVKTEPESVKPPYFPMPPINIPFDAEGEKKAEEKSEDEGFKIDVDLISDEDLKEINIPEDGFSIEDIDRGYIPAKKEPEVERNEGKANEIKAGKNEIDEIDFAQELTIDEILAQNGIVEQPFEPVKSEVAEKPVQTPPVNEEPKAEPVVEQKKEPLKPSGFVLSASNNDADDDDDDEDIYKDLFKDV